MSFSETRRWMATRSSSMDLIAKITKTEPWNEISFIGPPAASASVTASASRPGVEMQLLSGTQVSGGGGGSKDADAAGGTPTVPTGGTPAPLAGSLRGFLGADRTLAMRWQSKAAEVTRKSLVTVDTAASALVTPTVIKFTTSLRCEILQAAVPRLAVALPATNRHQAFAVDSVYAQKISLKSSLFPRRIELAAPQTDIPNTYGEWQLFAPVSQHLSSLDGNMTIAGMHPLGTEKLSGYITVATDLGIAAKTASFESLTEIPFASVLGERVASGGSALAYKFIAVAPAVGQSWKLSVTTETVEPWLRAEIMNTITLTETLVSGRTLVKYDIANAPVKDFRLQVPSAFRNVEGTGAQIRAPGRGEWRVAGRASKQGARGVFADGDVGAAPSRPVQPRRAGGHPGAGGGARGRLRRYRRPAPIAGQRPVRRWVAEQD